MWPDELEMPAAGVAKPINPDRPITATRWEFALAAEGVERPVANRPRIRTHNAHEAVEYAKQLGVAAPFIYRVYRAYWANGLDINSLSVLKLLATGLVPDVTDFEAAIVERRFADHIVGFDEAAHATGVYNLPTFWVGETRMAEQPYKVLRNALQGHLGTEPLELPYSGIDFPNAPATRPYTYINMVATIDGKTVTGTRNDAVADLGSSTDHSVMRWLEETSDGVMLGAGSLRSTPGLWYRKDLFRFVVTYSGKIDYTCRFFTDSPEKAYLVGPGDWQQIPHDNMKSTLQVIKSLGVERLLIEGGSELNASLLKEDLVDELFLTVAPKVKLGRDIPTYAGGDPLPKDALLQFVLVESHTVGNEVFLRYRRNR